MKFCIVFGSPRQHGNTAALLSVFTEELRRGGHEVTQFDAYKSRISGCRACLGCQGDLSRICCVIQDDMQPILRAVEDCDTLVFAAPIYVWSLPAPIKAVLDRLVYSGCKYYGDNPHGPSLFAGKRLVLLTTCGYPPEKGTDLYEEAMRRYCKYTQMVYGGMLCERQRNLKEPFMDEQKHRRAVAFARSLTDCGI